ncbi:MAG TPA: hypothetical protein VKU84_11805 [Stellaceae bacterium]|nr:hypothetical protein [Stellaceae bacterium]
MADRAGAQTLSGGYKGTITYMPRDGATAYDDHGATLVVTPDPKGGGDLAVVTYSDHLGRYREVCSVTHNSDGTITLRGVSYTILSGSSFSPDTFTIRVAKDGSISGTSVDTNGGTTTLSMRH